MIGFRVLKRTRAVSAAWVAKYRSIPVSNVSDSMSRMVGPGAALVAMHAGGAMAGPALTVRVRPGDNLMLHKALDMITPGDVVVCDAGGETTSAVFGEMMLTHAEKRGVAGLVIYGAIRDAGAIADGDTPVFALGASHRGPYKDGPGEINVPISIGGMVIEPGDLVLGDEDGVLAVPFDAVAAVHAAAAAKQAAEAEQLAAFANGTADRAWVDATLKRLGCVVET